RREHAPRDRGLGAQDGGVRVAVRHDARRRTSHRAASRGVAWRRRRADALTLAKGHRRLCGADGADSRARLRAANAAQASRRAGTRDSSRTTHRKIVTIGRAEDAYAGGVSAWFGARALKAARLANCRRP